MELAGSVAPAFTAAAERASHTDESADVDKFPSGRVRENPLLICSNPGHYAPGASAGVAQLSVIFRCLAASGERLHTPEKNEMSVLHLTAAEWIRSCCHRVH